MQKHLGWMEFQSSFTRFFNGHLKELMLNVYKECFWLKRIFQSGRNGITSLIPKKGKDLRKLGSWRPTILLCVDYKSISKIIANHVKTVLGRIIDKDQSGFLSGPSLAENIRKVIDTIRYVDQKKLNFLLLQIDFRRLSTRLTTRV